VRTGAGAAVTRIDLIAVGDWVRGAGETENVTAPISMAPPARCRLETLAVTAGRPARLSGASLNPAVHFASTYVGSDDITTTVGYGRDGNETWRALEEAIGALEGGRALTFASGMAACHAVLELLDPGAVVVLPRECYLGVSAAVEAPAGR
jgi:cystathionine gamma-synthase